MSGRGAGVCDQGMEAAQLRSPAFKPEQRRQNTSVGRMEKTKPLRNPPELVKVKLPGRSGSKIMFETFLSGGRRV